MMFISHRLRRTQRLSLCGVLFAFVVQILAWSVMPVSAQSTLSDDGWVVICTSDGFKRISLVEAGMPPAPSNNDNHSTPILVDHCDLCVFAHGLGPGPAPVFLLEAAVGVEKVRLRTAYSAMSGKSHRRQQPRAPPVSELI